MVNSHDLGRQIQQSYYAPPDDFDPNHNQSPQYGLWPWNAAQSGDAFGNPGQVLASRNDGREIYVKSQPMVWSLDNVPAEATMEEWISLDGPAAHVRCRLICQRTDDPGPPSPRHQELPAVYTVGTLYRLFTYEGLEPFTNGPLTELPAAGPPSWQTWRATENWSALVDKTGWGLGVRHAGVVEFLGGFSGTPGRGGPTDFPTGYFAPVCQETLDAEITYEYTYDLILGSLEEIRSWVYGHPADPRPDYRFSTDRQHWIPLSGDSAPPTGGHLRVNLEGDDPKINGPVMAARAEDVPRLYISAAYTLSNSTPATAIGRLFWEVDNAGGFCDQQSLSFDIIPDGQYHTYALDLGSLSSYAGLISRLRFDPVVSGQAGDCVDIAWISWQDLSDVGGLSGGSLRLDPQPAAVSHRGECGGQPGG